MERFVLKMMLVVMVVVVVNLLNHPAAAADQDNVVKLDDYFLNQFKIHLRDWVYKILHNQYANKIFNRVKDSQIFKQNDGVFKILEYIVVLKKEIILRFAKGLEDVTTESIYDDLTSHCSKDLEDLTDKINNTTCVRTRLKELLLSRLEEATDVIVEMCSALCNQEKLVICSTQGCTCPLEFGYLRQLVKNYVGHYVETSYYDRDTTPLGIIIEYVAVVFKSLEKSFNVAVRDWLRTLYIKSKSPDTEMLTYENILNNIDYNIVIKNSPFSTTKTSSEEQLTWGIVRSKTHTYDFPCQYWRSTTDIEYYLIRCDPMIILKSSTKLMRCFYKNTTSVPLAWSTVPSVFVHSQCLCLANNGMDCGIHDRTYCLSVLLRDLQRQISYRPAITYLDYAIRTRIPVCMLTKLLQVSFRDDCVQYEVFNTSKPELCYFQDLFNKDVNCTKPEIMDSSDKNKLCYAMRFMRNVLCNSDENDRNFGYYYRSGDSTLVLTLTYADVALRVLTLVTYLACSQLRNLPGKLLIGYQMTALLRLLAVRASFEDLQVVVNIDVSMDLASTMWLTAYLHFLTKSLQTLRLPDSYSTAEARMVLLRYALFAWALPAALSWAFFTMDEALEGHVQVGQVLFLLCNYTALIGNLFMFYHNCKFFFKVKSDARQLLRCVRKRSVFTGLFNFALKMSVLSGAGIIFRLLFTQFQGMEEVLSYYQALGTSHGLLLFVMYGCNREARVFWLSVWRSIQSCCHLGRNTSSRRNSLELRQRPMQDVAGTLREEVLVPTANPHPGSDHEAFRTEDKL